jgi:Fic family protein
MGSFLGWINGTGRETHSILRAGMTHYEIVRIHPFLDGNGRVARALATLVLFKSGYDIKRFFSLEEYFDREPMHYYDALQSVGKADGNLTGWLEYFTEGLAIELTRIKEKVKSLSTDLKIKKSLGGQQMALTERQIKIVEYVQENGFLQNKAFFELFPMISEDTVLRELKDLLEKGIVKKEGTTKGARYVLRTQ